MNELVLVKDLPGCPKGRIFKEDMHGGYFNSMTDEEAVNGKIKSYVFNKKEMEEYQNWFTDKARYELHDVDKYEKIDIPEDLQQICRDLAIVAQQHKLYRLSGTFSPPTHWGGQISFSWEDGRHGVKRNSISISSNFQVHTEIIHE